METFWNYEPASCRKVRVIVGPAPKSTWWCAGLEGTEREAVEVTIDGERFYLDNEAFEGDGLVRGHRAGTGWDKVTKGRGGPDWGHSSLPVSKVLD